MFAHFKHNSIYRCIVTVCSIPPRRAFAYYSFLVLLLLLYNILSCDFRMVSGENMVSKQAGQTAEDRQKTRRNDNQRKRETTDSNAHRFELLDRELFASVKQAKPPLYPAIVERYVCCVFNAGKKKNRKRKEKLNYSAWKPPDRVPCFPQ